MLFLSPSQQNPKLKKGSRPLRGLPIRILFRIILYWKHYLVSGSSLDWKMLFLSPSQQNPKLKKGSRPLRGLPIRILFRIILYWKHYLVSGSSLDWKMLWPAAYMSRDSGQGTVRDRSLQDLEGLDWGEANFDSHLVKFPRSQSPGYFAMRSTGGWRWPAISCRLSGERQIAREDRRKIDMMPSFVEFFVLTGRTSWTRNRIPSIQLEKELAAASWLRF